MIQGNLEYLLSSLPNLTFHNSVEIRKRISSILRKYAGPVHEEDDLIDILDAEAEKFLSPGLNELFTNISLDKIHEPPLRQSGNKVVADYATWMHHIKDELAAMRRARRNNSKQSGQKKRALPIEGGSPLEEEVQLLKLQWDKAEEVSVGHFADFGELVAYKLKLMILLRWWSFDANKGFEIFNKITKTN